MPGKRKNQIIEPDWDSLSAMITELAESRNMYKSTGEVSLRKLSEAIGKAPTALYPIMDRYHKPTADTLAALADYAARTVNYNGQTYPPIPHLSERSAWLQVGGITAPSEAEREREAGLSPAERKILGVLRHMSEEHKQRMYRQVLATYRIFMTDAEQRQIEGGEQAGTDVAPEGLTEQEQDEQPQPNGSSKRA